jgi:hypothetical protein
MAAVGGRYRYPLIIDYGWASFLYLFPSLFIRQIDLEVFGDGAVTTDRSLHRSAGGAIFLRTLWGGAVPVTIYYQIAQRFDDGLGVLHIFALSFE